MAKAAFKLVEFKFDRKSDLSSEHSIVSEYVEAAMRSLDPNQWPRAELGPRKVAGGQVFVEATPSQARRFVLAALAQVKHWDAEADQYRTKEMRKSGGFFNYHSPAWAAIWGRRRHTEAIITMLTNRALPMQEEDVVSLVEWCVAAGTITTWYWPVANVVRTAERLAASGPVPQCLIEPLNNFASKLRSCNDKDAKKWATRVEQLAAHRTGSQEKHPKVSAPPAPPPEPAPAGNPLVLRQLKRYMGVAQEVNNVTESEEGLDRVSLPGDSPLQDEHRLLSKLFSEVIGKIRYNDPDFHGTATGKKINSMDEEARGRFMLAAAERKVAAMLAPLDLHDHRIWQSRSAAEGTAQNVMALPFRVERDGAFDLLLFLAATVTFWSRPQCEKLINQLIDQVERVAASRPLSEGERHVLHLLRGSSIGGPPLGSPSDDVRRLTRLIGDNVQFYLVPGEYWSDAVNTDLASLAPKQRGPWVELLRHLLSASSPRPSNKWLKTAGDLSAKAGIEDVAAAVERWLPLVPRGRSFRRVAHHYDPRTSADVIHEENARVLRGLLWLIPTLPQKHQLARHVALVANSAYRKVPGVGPRAVKVGNAAVYALSEIGSPEAVGQLAMLKVRVKFGTAQKEIEKAFTAAAQRLGMSREDIEELGVPTYGLEEVGVRRETFGGEFVAELRVDGREVSTTWERSDGKALKSVPAAVKQQFKEDLKELQGAAKDIAAMLPAQCERLDSMFLLQKRWPVAAWRERYLNHPLVGTIARRLIWNFTSGDKSKSGIWHGGRLVDVEDKPLAIAEDAQVELWHPIGRPMDDVLAWRGWLEGHEVRQPFKQAHRELYLLTEAERRTETYSNRFAAHVLRQHQFNALCAARGWKNKLRLMVDDSCPPASRELPNWGFRAEFWIESIGDNYGTDTNDSGAFLRISTDQVRFYRTAAATNYSHAFGGSYTSSAAGPGADNVNTPIALEQVPPLVLSEIMRDVDLFVGVASVGNDPTWQDGGPEGRFRTYWQGYSFGELSESAKTRRAVLESLLPRLTKIRERCSLAERFLVVRGDLRTYKIHLGSGNILMEPNDQYLCIVPSRGKEEGGGVFLPFEGDATLSIILSKAFLLAEDKKIKDETITRQIGGG
jgi:hypothetical protein